MAQRLTQQRTIFVKEEITEGVDPANYLGTDAILVSNLTLSPSRAFLPRKYAGTFGQRFGVIGNPDDPTLSFTCELKGGLTAVTPEIDLLWKSVFGKRQDDAFSGKTLGTVTNASTFAISPDATGITDPTDSPFNPNAIAIETGPSTGKYEIGFIKQIDTNTVTLLQPLSFTPTTGNVKPTITYGLATSGHKSLSFRVWLDTADYVTFVGCQGSVKLDVPAPGTIGTATFTFKAFRTVFTSAGDTKPIPVYDTTVPPTVSRFRIDAASTNIKAASWDLAQMIAKKQSQTQQFGTFAQIVADRDLKGTLQLFDENNDQFSSWDAGTVFAIGHQMGDTLNNIAGYQVLKAQRSKVSYGDDAGLTTDQVDFQGNAESGNDEAAVAYA